MESRLASRRDEPRTRVAVWLIEWEGTSGASTSSDADLCGCLCPFPDGNGKDQPRSWVFQMTRTRIWKLQFPMGQLRFEP